jgi:hypothetical protein
MSLIHMVICDYCHDPIHDPRDVKTYQPLYLANSVGCDPAFHYHTDARPCWTIILRLLQNGRQYEGVEPNGRRDGIPAGTATR